MTIKTLDVVVEQGEQSSRSPVRVVARALDRARSMVGLRKVARHAEIPPWEGRPPEQPMWATDRNKLHKHRLDTGILKEEDTGDGAPAADVASTVVALKVYFKRGCPYTRAAVELLRERDIPFEEQDVTTDESTRGWLKIVTGKSTTPQIFIHGEPIGGYDELRGLDLDGTLRARIAKIAPAPPAAEQDDEPAVAEMGVKELKDRVDDGAHVLLLDVREDAEVRAGMLSHAVHIPLGQLEARCSELDPEGVWIVYCKSGQRSLTAAQQLVALGFRSVANLEGGFEAWRAMGGAVVGFGDTEPRKTPGRLRLPVIHPERSPFEGLDDGSGVSEADAPRLDGAELIARVREVLDECRPMVQADGGDIELLDVVGDVVHVQLTGNCIGCPSSQATLKQGIERRLVSRIPQLTGIASPQL